MAARPLSSWWASVRIPRGLLAREALAGVPGAIGGVPDGMASSALVGVNPVYGLYAGVAGPIVGGLLSSTPLMVVATTSAASLAAASAIEDVPAAERPEALFLLTLLAGAFMVLAGFLRLGRYTRFVARSVMIGFLTGVAVNIVCSQLPDLTGIEGGGGVPAHRALRVAGNLGDLQGGELLCGAAAMVAVVVLGRGRLAPFAAIAALVLPAAGVAVLDADVLLVRDQAEIPTGLPSLHLPDPGVLDPQLLGSALALALIVLVQGVGVSEAVPHAGPPPEPNRDFVAQGVANLTSGLVRGMPVGGSVGQSALNLTAGARTRWASVFSGLWLLVIIVALGGVVGRVPVATLAGLLVIAGLQAVRTREISAVLSVRRSSAIAMVVTFVATLLLPVAQAVGVGVLVSILLQLNQDALDLRVVELRTGVEGHTEEHPAPERLRPREVVVLDVYGSLYYAGAQTLQRRLPDPTGVDAPVVVLRLRGRGFPPATFFFVIREYAQQLDEAGGRLYLSGVDPAVRARYGDLGGALTGPFNVVEATTVLGESTAEARAMGEDWLRRHNGGSERETD